MSDRREMFTSVSDGSWPQVKIALRLRLGNPDHAASVGGNEARQQILQSDILGLLGIAAGGKLKAGLGELTPRRERSGLAESEWNARSAWP
jgi:hypothetical protein